MPEERLVLLTCTDKSLAEAIAKEVISRAKQEDIKKNADLNLGDVDINLWYKND